MLVFLITISVIGLLVLLWFLSRTKTVTTEARLGQFEIIILPSGDRITGLTSLARGMVKEEYLQTLAQTERITDQQAKDMNAAFEKLFFYGIRSGRRRILVVSNQNIESPAYSIPLEQVFELPFGYVTRRLVVGDGVSAELPRAGWRVYTINPRNVQVEDLVGERYKNMVNIADAAGCVRDAAIRIQKEIPYREIAAAREHQLEEANANLAKMSHKLGLTQMALANKPLLETPSIPIPESKVSAKTMSWDRIVVPIIAFFISQYAVPFIKPDILDPTPYSIGIAALLFLFYPWIKSKIKAAFF